MKNIFIGNLSFNTTEEELRALFEAHGAVDKVTLMRNRDTGQPRGFGFVEMTNDSEAEKAISSLNGSNLGGRTINVDEARPRPERSFAPRAGGRRERFGGGQGGRGGGRGRY